MYYVLALNKKESQWQYFCLMLVATSLFPIISSANTNDNQLGPSSVSFTLSSPLNQADIHSRKHFTGSPLCFSSISTSVDSYSPNCRPNLCHTAHAKC